MQLLKGYIAGNRIFLPIGQLVIWCEDLNDKSRMTGDCHVRILESVGVKSPCATYPNRQKETGLKSCDIYDICSQRHLLVFSIYHRIMVIVILVSSHNFVNLTIFN